MLEKINKLLDEVEAMLDDLAAAIKAISDLIVDLSAKSKEKLAEKLKT